MARLFLDIDVVRTQSYLARSGSLRGRRGASAMLIDLASQYGTDVVDALGAGWSADPDAPHIDGKLSLVAEPPPDDPAAAARRAVTALRQHLPAAELHASWFAGDDRFADRPADDGRPDTGALVAPAATPEWPLARPCDRCGIDPASALVTRPETARVCDDCSRRERSGGDASPHEAGIVDALRRAGTDPVRVAHDFHELVRQDPAAAGGRRRNHLATIFADANQLGAAISRVAERHHDDPDQRRRHITALSAAVTDAVDTALTDSAVAIHELAGSPPVATTVPHVKGGDDVLVTVPASLWSAFVQRYLDEFHRVLTERGFGDITTSLGIVIAHHKHPFHDIVDTAAELLADAKSAHGGSRAALAWVDLTDERPGTHEPVTARWLDEHRPQLDDLARAPQAGRSGLASAARRGPDALRNQAARHHVPGAEPFVEAGPSTMLAALSLTRWWTPTVEAKR